MTCTAMCGASDGKSGLLRGEDGLSPEVSHLVEKSGYVLTCSSYVKADGLTLELGQNHNVWELMYKKRFESEEARFTARAAMARVIRKSAERNVERWAEETEEVLQKSSDDI